MSIVFSQSHMDQYVQTTTLHLLPPNNDLRHFDVSAQKREVEGGGR